MGQVNEESTARQRSKSASGNGAADRREVLLPGLGHLPLPSGKDAIYLGGLAVLAAAELIDWPVALAVAIGHEIVTRTKNSQGHAA